MKIKQTRNGTSIKFDKPGEGLVFVAKMNESYGNYASAARLFRQAGREEDAARCDNLAKPEQP